MSDTIYILSSDDDEEDNTIPALDKKAQEIPVQSLNAAATVEPPSQSSNSKDKIEECFQRKVQSLKQSLLKKKKHEKTCKVTNNTFTNQPKKISATHLSSNSTENALVNSNENISKAVAPSPSETLATAELQKAVIAPTTSESTTSVAFTSPPVSNTATPLASESHNQQPSIDSQPKPKAISPPKQTQISIPNPTVFKPNVSQIMIKKSPVSKLPSTTMTTVPPSSTVNSFSVQKPTPDCIVLDDSDDEDDSTAVRPKAMSSNSISTPKAKVRLENVVGKLLTNSTGKQSIVHVSSNATAVRLALLKGSSSSPSKSASSSSLPSKSASSSKNHVVSHPSTQVQAGSSTVSPPKVNKKVTKQMRIQILEKKLETLERRINQFAAKEISLNDLDREESPYIQEAKLKEDFVNTWKKYCRLIGEDADSVIHARKKVKVSSSPFPEINREVEKYINRTGSFPNLFDIKNVCQQANNKYHLNIKLHDLQHISIDVFTEVGRKLQKHREKELRATSGNLLTDIALKEQDPALEDDELKRKLKSNRRIAKKRTEDVFSDFVRQQYDQMGSGGGNNATDSQEEEEDSAHEYESLRKKDLIENKKIKQKLIKNKIKGQQQQQPQPPVKKMKISESTTVINVTLSSSQEEDRNKKKKIDCRVTFNASPKSSANNPQFPTKSKSPLHSVSTPAFSSSSPKTLNYPAWQKPEPASQIQTYPGFPKRKHLTSSSSTSSSSPKTVPPTAASEENSSYESPLKRFRTLPNHHNNDKTLLANIEPPMITPKKEHVLVCRPIISSRSNEIVVIDSDDDE